MAFNNICESFLLNKNVLAISQKTLKFCILIYPCNLPKKNEEFLDTMRRVLTDACMSAQHQENKNLYIEFELKTIHLTFIDTSIWRRQYI